MCGLYGIAGRGIQPSEDFKVYFELGIINMLRGTDSTGYYEAHDFTGKDKLLKETGDFSYFAWSRIHGTEAKKNPSQRIFDDKGVDLIMGHNRAATVGSVTDENAQPFRVGNLVLAHNGTLRDSKYRVENLKDNPAKMSDTYFFAKDVAERGLFETLCDLDQKSAWAITLWDTKNKTLTFVRNTERPLYFAVNHSRNVMYWSSEKEALVLVLNRNKINYKGWETDKKTGESKSYGGIYEFYPGAIYECALSDIKSKTNIFKIKNRVFTWSVEEKQWVYTKPQVKEEPKTKEKGTNVVPFDPPFLEKLKNTTSKVVDLGEACGGCGRRLSPWEQYQIRKKMIPGVLSSSGIYYCQCVASDPKDGKNKVIVH